MSDVKSNSITNIDVVLVSKEAPFFARANTMATEFNFSLQSVAGLDDLLDKFSEISVNFVILPTESAKTKEEAIGMVQVARQVSPNGFIMVVLGKNIDNSALTWIRKSGADVVILESEYFDSCKLEYFAFNSIRLDYIAVKPGDFIEGSSLNFVVYHFMPQNRKYLPVIHKDTKIEEKKIARMKNAGDVYIKRSDISHYFKYVSTTHDNSAKGLVSRCRGQFLTLTQSYFDLIITLTEQSDKPSYDDGKKLLNNCQTMAADLLNSLMTVGQVQEVIGSPQSGDFGSVERAPERAAMAGFFSLLSEIGKPEDVMLATLIMDIGILALSPMVLKKMRAQQWDTFTPDEKREYELHPQKSISYALSRKLQLNNVVKDAITYSHSRCDVKGFPPVNTEKVTLEAQMLRFSEELDQLMVVAMGKPRPIFKEVFENLVKNNSDFASYNPNMIMGLKSVLGSI